MKRWLLKRELEARWGRSSRRFGVTTFMVLALYRPGIASPRAVPLPGPLATPWPSTIECLRFDRLELSVGPRKSCAAIGTTVNGRFLGGGMVVTMRRR
jgi:hypothetical protein